MKTLSKIGIIVLSVNVGIEIATTGPIVTNANAFAGWFYTLGTVYLIFLATVFIGKELDSNSKK
jgi:hypothetical protein